MNYEPYLGAIRGEHVRAAARSIGAALIEQPGLEALLSVREGCEAGVHTGQGQGQGETAGKRQCNSVS